MRACARSGPLQVDEKVLAAHMSTAVATQQVRPALGLPWFCRVWPWWSWDAMLCAAFVLRCVHLFTQVGPVDLLIRTSGEQRLSNFVLLEAAYAEIFFTDVCWPAFGERDLVLALEAFATRKRRFGRRQP